MTSRQARAAAPSGGIGSTEFDALAPTCLGNQESLFVRVFIAQTLHLYPFFDRAVSAWIELIIIEAVI